MTVALLVLGLGVGAAVTYGVVSASGTSKVSSTSTTSTTTDTSEVASLQSQLALWQANASALQSQITKLDNQTAFDAREISSLQANATSTEAQIASLQGVISIDKTQILALQGVNSTDSAQIQSLQANATAAASQITILTAKIEADNTDIASLDTQLSSDQGIIYGDAHELFGLQQPFVSGNFTETANCPVSGDCSYSINGVYANFGTNEANNASVTFTFYSQAAMAGQALCTSTVALGNLSGRAVALLPQATCDSSSSTQAQSFGWTFKNT